MGRSSLFILLVAVAAGIGGCTATDRHLVLTTIFDGVPSMPTAEEICRDHGGVKRPEGEEQVQPAVTGSFHKPYQEKKCNDCHDKTKKQGLVRSPTELCYMCHTKFKLAGYVHGPAAAAGCSACHQPHDSPYKALLKRKSSEICFMCHKEERLGSEMHSNFAGRKMECIDCHDPHSSRLKYLLR